MEASGSLRATFVCFVLVLCWHACSAYEYAAIEKWIRDNGGALNTTIAVNKDGIRGLLMTVDAKKGDVAAIIPTSCMINTGQSANPSVLTASLNVLRELRHPNSRFKPYLDIFPGPNDIMSVCNFPLEYIPLLDSDYWAGQINNTHNYLEKALKGQAAAGTYEWTVQEVVGGSQPVTLEELKYACAVASARQVGVGVRHHNMLVPIYDMMNHYNKCPTVITTLKTRNKIHVVLGEDLKKGDELCNLYKHDMRDDYSVVHYGFMAKRSNPLRLLSVDHPSFNPNKEMHLSEAPFTGSKKQMTAERDRLQRILDGLLARDKELDLSQFPEPGKDWRFDTVMALRQRRREALRQEIGRLSALVKPRA